jgi:predicted RecA/RadA family phage recombinase
MALPVNVSLFEGDVLDWTNGTGSAVVLGEPVAFGTYGVGIAKDAIANTAVGPVALCGVFRMAKTAGAAINQGAQVFITLGAGTTTAATATATKANHFVGFASATAASADTEVYVKLAPFTAEQSREITLAATGAETISPQACFNGKGLSILIPNSAAKAVTFPVMSTIPEGMIIQTRKTAADAFAFTSTAGSGDAFVGTLGTTDANNDRQTFITATGGAVVIATTIA